MQLSSAEPDLSHPRAAQAFALSALAENRVCLAFQPVRRCNRSRGISFHEGLVRIVGEKGRVSAAASFMPALYGTPAELEMDKAALRIALLHLEAIPTLRLSINISPLTIGHPEWLSILMNVLLRDPGVGARLIVEITESAAMSDPEQATEFMRALAVYGVSFALDDFGAGQTSFRYLRDFRFDLVKIDGSYTRGIETNVDHRVLVEALVGISRHFEMFTVAEYVTSPQEARTLGELGVDCLQGYLMGKPNMQPGWINRCLRQAI